MSSQPVKKIDKKESSNSENVTIEGENMINSKLIAMQNLSKENTLCLRNTTSLSVNTLTQENSESDDARYVYFAIERKWSLVGPGIFRK